MDDETFNYGGGLFRAAMRRCDDCYAERPLAWYGRHIRICEPCRKVRDAARAALEPHHDR